MNWALAIEKNHGALRRILAMLVAMVGVCDPCSPREGGWGGGCKCWCVG